MYGYTHFWLPILHMGLYLGCSQLGALINKIRLPCGSDSKETACNAGDPGSIPGLGRSPREGNGNSLQYSYLENSVDIEAWRATIRGVTKSQT